MSGYFARLAERTGLGGVPARPARAANIVEHGVEVEAPPAGVVAVAGTPSGSLLGSARADAAPPDANPLSMESTTIGPEGTREQPAASSAALATEKPPILEPWTLARTPSAEAPRSRENAPPLPPAGPAAPGQERRGAAWPAPSSRVRAIDAEAQRREATDAGLEAGEAESASIDVSFPAPRLKEHTSQSPSAALPERGSGPASVGRAPSHEDRPDSSHLKAELALPRPQAKEKHKPVAQDVSVHIGAIQIEIRPPVPPPSPPAPARAEAARERPRFEPRRHYLRW
jgi:hypothetical protein